MPSQFSIEITKLKRELSLSYSQLAYKTGISRATIIRWCQGGVADASSLKQFLGALHVGSEVQCRIWLLHGSDAAHRHLKANVPEFLPSQALTLRGMRLAKGVSRFELAAAIGRTVATIRKYECGDQAVPKDVLPLMGAALALSDDDARLLRSSAPGSGHKFFELTRSIRPPAEAELFFDRTATINVWEFFAVWPWILVNGAHDDRWREVAHEAAGRAFDNLLYSHNEELSLWWSGHMLRYFHKYMPGSDAVAAGYGLQDWVWSRRTLANHRPYSTLGIERLSDALEQVKPENRAWLQRRLARHLALMDREDEAWRVFDLSCNTQDSLGILEELSWRAHIHECLGQIPTSLDFYARCFDEPMVFEGQVTIAISALKAAAKDRSEQAYGEWSRIVSNKLNGAANESRLQRHVDWARGEINQIDQTRRIAFRN